MKKFGLILCCIVITLLYPEVGCRIANQVSELFGIAWMYIHHLVQMTLALSTIFLVLILDRQKSLSDFGFNLKNYSWSVKISLKFSVGWVLIVWLLNLLFTYESVINYEQNWINLVADLFFDFIITPLSEEILFRGLIYSLFILYIPGQLLLGKFLISYAAIGSALLFSLAHIGFDFYNFKISSLNYTQLIFTSGLGLFYAIMREKSGSLVGPLLSHGISDGTITVVQIILNR